VPGAGIEPA